MEGNDFHIKNALCYTVTHKVIDLLLSTWHILPANNEIILQNVNCYIYITAATHCTVPRAYRLLKGEEGMQLCTQQNSNHALKIVTRDAQCIQQSYMKLLNIVTIYFRIWILLCIEHICALHTLFYLGESIHTWLYTIPYTRTHTRVMAYACSVTKQNHQLTLFPLHTRLGG